MQIPINELQRGMVLFGDIPIMDGKIVLKKGQKLTAEIIAALLKSGITTVNVEDTANFIGPIPSITVKIEKNGDSARLIVEPTGNDNETITVEILKDHLNKAGVIHGIDEVALRMIATRWLEKKRRYEINYAAVGTPAQPGKEGPLRMRVRSISAYTDFEKIQKAKFYWQIADIAHVYQKVEPGTIVGEKEIEIPSSCGSNVKGEPVFTDEIIKTTIKLDKGVSLSKDGNRVISTITGFAYNFDDMVGVVEVNFDGSVEIVPSEDKMSATLVVHNPGQGGKMPDEKELRTSFVYKGVTFGIHEEVFKNTMFGFTQNQFPAEPLVVAEGVSPRNGENGKLEFLFSIETSLKPKENPDGSVDYKNVDIINSVSKGDRLVKVIAPTKGIPGKNVSGEIVACLDGAPAKHPIGQNTEIDSKDQAYVVSSIDGVVHYTGSVVEVNEGFVIKGDVDFSTGHINYEKSVIVTGDVKGGFNVICGGDLQIGGVIEDCQIIVGGNILCKHGLVGQGKGIVEAKGDINLGFMKNQTVKSKKDINIAREALNCTIYARKKIQVHGNPLSIAGGTLVARDAIILNTVGNHSGIRTTLEVGIDYTLVEELEKTEKLFNEHAVNYSKLMETHSKYNKTIALKGKLSTQERTFMDKLVESMAKYKQQMNALEERKKMIQKKMYYLDIAYIKIERAAFPGTLFKFGERNHLLKDELIGPKIIRIINHEIRIL